MHCEKMELHVYNLLFFVLIVLCLGHPSKCFETIKMCRHNCSWLYKCKIDHCHTHIECGHGKRINITNVKYSENDDSCWRNCGSCCYKELRIIPSHTDSITRHCSGKLECNLETWNKGTNWRLKIKYACEDSTTFAPSTTTTTTTVRTKEATTTIQPSTETKETTDSTSPHIVATDSWSQQTENTDSWSHQTENTDSWSQQTDKLNTDSWSQQTDKLNTDSWSQQTDNTDSWSQQTENTDLWSQQTKTTESLSTPIETTDSSSSTTVQSSPHSPEQSTDSSRIVKTMDEESADFPLGDATAIPVGIVVMILVIVGIVCVVRRRSNGTTKSKQIEENTLPMQNMTDNNSDNPPTSGNRKDLQEAHEQEYVDTTSHRGALNLTFDSVEHEYVDTNQGGINTTDDDEYNTLNTHQSHVQIDPNYDHLPKCSHTTVDERYSHVTGSQTAVPDATYSHLQNSKSKSSHNTKSNQNNSNNVYNHINTLSVEENVYNNIQTNFTRNHTSNLSQSRTEEDDYDHTDWNKAKSPNPIASSNGAIKTSDTKKLAEHADDEYAVVNKKSDQVESNDGNNYFVLEKQSF